jgi:hypothetical protein
VNPRSRCFGPDRGWPTTTEGGHYVFAVTVTGQGRQVVTPETRYARNGTINLAYQVLGDANRQAPDIVVVSGFVSHVAQAWRLPLLAAFFADCRLFHE